ESSPVIDNGALHPAASAGHFYFHPVSLRMTRSVSERLLDYAKHTSSVGVRQRIQRRIHFGMNFDTTRSGDLPDQPGESRSQPKIVQHRRPKQHGYVTNDPK